MASYRVTLRVIGKNIEEAITKPEGEVLAAEKEEQE